MAALILSTLRNDDKYRADKFYQNNYRHPFPLQPLFLPIAKKIS